MTRRCRAADLGPESTPLPESSHLLRAVIDVSALKKLLHLSLRPGWRVVIVDATGRLVYHSLDLERP